MIAIKKIPLLTFLVLLFATGFNEKADQIDWHSMQEAQELASSEGKKILVYAQASWCTYCRKMEKEVFTQSGVQQAISEFFYPVSIDIESDDIITYNSEEMTEVEFSGSMRISATPTFIFIDPKGNVLGTQPGYMPPDIFKALLTYVGSDAFSRVKFDHYYENEYEKE